jgi:hypothetical protein
VFSTTRKKGIPLKEMGKLVGDEAETNIYSQDQPVSHICSGEEKAKDDAGTHPDDHKETVDIEKGVASDQAVR